jgi:hypothetical protein
MYRFALALLVSLSLALATTSRGSIAFVGFNSDGSDDFAVVALTPYPAGSVFRFQENEWSGSAFNTGEGAFSWTSTGPITAGAILRFKTVSAISWSVVDGFDVAVPGLFVGSNMALANSEEGLYAFIGSSTTAVTTPLASIRTNVTVDSGALFSSGVNLTLGNGVAPKQYNGDVWAYTGPTNLATGTLLDFAPLIGSLANWTLQADGTGDQSGMWMPPTGVFTIGAVPEPSAALFGLLIATLSAAKPRRVR